MKRLFPFALLLCAISATPALADIQLSAPSTATGSFDVLVEATNVFAAPHDADFLLGYGFNVTFDSSLLQFTGETAGALFDDLSPLPGAEVAGVATAILLGPGDFTEPLELAVLHFKVVGSGATSIGITGDPSDPNEGLVYLSGSDAISASTRLTTSAVATPEPGTALLLFGVFAGLAAARKMRRA